MKDVLTIVLVLKSGGDFHFSDVELLTHHLNKQLTKPFRIICLTDLFSTPTLLANNIELIPFEHDWPIWWSKMNMFSPAMEKYRPFLYMDLDTLVIDNIDCLFPPKDPTQFTTLENCYYPNRPGSGLMWIPANNEKVSLIWNTWIKNPEPYLGRSIRQYGDQNFIEDLTKVDAYFGKDKIDTFKPKPKQAWRTSYPKGLAICYFHGYPRPSVAAQTVQWVRDYINHAKTVNTTTGIKKAYVINLEHRNDRLKEFKSQTLPFTVEHFPAIKNEQGIKGCNASHKAILKLNNELPFVVFEDDCKFVQGWSVVTRAMTELPENWDLLYVGANLNKPLATHSEHLFNVKDAWTTHGIIYGSQRVVDYIINNMPTDTTPIDVFYSQKVLEKFNCFVVSPLVAVQRGSYSDIMNGERDYAQLMLDNFTKNTTKQNFTKWFADKGDKTHRLNYTLTKNSIVFDVGGLEGTFVESIHQKFGCKVYVFEPVPAYFQGIVDRFSTNPNITVINKAIAHKGGEMALCVDGDKSGFFGKGSMTQVDCLTLDKAMSELHVQQIDLLKLNIEGAEYDVLDHMIKNKITDKCKNIQVQFHTFVPDYQNKYDTIADELSKTFRLTYRYPFIWENWERI
jgi:FkbM family methyltransferase